MRKMRLKNLSLVVNVKSMILEDENSESSHHNTNNNNNDNNDKNSRHDDDFDITMSTKEFNDVLMVDFFLNVKLARGMLHKIPWAAHVRK